MAFYFKNMEQPFAKPIEPVKPIDTNKTTGADTSTREGNIDLPISHYKDLNEVPYTVKHFNITGYDFDAIRGNVDILDNYIISQINERSLNDTKESYEQIVNEMFGLLGIEENTRNEIKFNKIVQYINFLGRAKNAKRTRNAMKRYLKNN